MTNVPNRATAEGLPSLTRRLFLRGAAFVAPLAAVPSLAVAMPSYVEENAKLLAMEPTIEAAEAEMIAANVAFREALRIGTNLWPRAPECILYDAGKYDWNIERCILGGGYDNPKGLFTARYLQGQLAYWKRRRKPLAEVQDMRQQLSTQLAAAEAYEAACAHAKEASGVMQAQERRQSATNALRDCIAAVHTEPAHTMAGVRLKAKAFMAWEQAPGLYRMSNLNGEDQWMPGLARTLLATLDA